MIIRFRALLLRVEILKFIAALFSLFVAACDPQNPSFEELDAYLSQNNTDAIIIIQNGEVVHERYFGTFTQSEKHNGYSLAKSFTNAAIGMALYEGNIKSLESDVFSLLPNYAEFESRGLTVEHLLQMQSGIKFLNKEHYAPMMDSADSLGYIADIPVEASPGELWRYKTDPTLLSGIIEQTTGQTLHDYMDQRLFEPLGINVSWDSDASGLTNGNAGIFMSARDYTKFGQLFLARGVWEGERIFDENWAAQSTRPCRSNARRVANVWDDTPQIVAGTKPLEYGFLWWCRRLPGLPQDSYYAFGGFGQFIIVVPSKDLVVVRLGTGPRYSDQTHLPKLTQLISSALRIED